MNIEHYSLREKKHARTKVALLNAFIERLKTTRFNNISITEICKSVEVSEGTFFNYFFEKIDVIDYFVSLMTTKVVYEIEKEIPENKYIEQINCMFEKFAIEFKANPNVIYEVISVLVAETEDGPKKILIPALEKYYAFPEYKEIEKIEFSSIEDFLHFCLVQAVAVGQLPKKTNIDEIMISLHTVMVGTLLTIKCKEFKNKDLNYHFQRQLNLIWSSLIENKKTSRG